MASRPTLTVSLTLDRAGAVYLNAFDAGGGFPVASVRACLAPASASCTPAAIPDPAYWPVTTSDVAHARRYQLHLSSTSATPALLGLHVGWSGSHALTIAGLVLPGGCDATSGYKAGCGARLHLTIPSTGPVTIASTSNLVKATVKDKTAATKLGSTTLRAPLTMQVPGGHEYSAHLFPAAGARVSALAITVTWR